MNVDELIAKWNVQREKDQEKFDSLFPDTDDILAIVLRGHLMVEGYIDRLNRHCFHNPEYYDQANHAPVVKLAHAQNIKVRPQTGPCPEHKGSARGQSVTECQRNHRSR